MTWNYRLVKRKKTYKDKEYISFGIHSAYYENKDAPKPHSISTEPMTLVSDSIDTIKYDLDKMRTALKKPILNYEDFEK